MDRGTQTNSQPTEARGQLTALRRGFFWLWGAVAFAVTGSLASAHEYTLPHPARDNRVLMGALAAQRRPEDNGRFAVTHVLYSACNCSQRIIDHLERRGARKDVAEQVVLVGRDEALAQRLSRAGYRLAQVTPTELKQRYAIEAAPMLIIVGPKEAVVYMGGYTTRKQGPDIQDVRLIDRATAGDDAFELPLLGCAVSQALQRALDPFALKYPLAEAGSDD